MAKPLRITVGAALVFFGLMFWQARMEAAYSLQINERTVGLIRFPLYPARIVLAGGTALLMVRLVLDLVIDTRRVVSGEAAEHADPTVPDPGASGWE